MFAPLIVFVDANVWYPRALRDWLGVFSRTRGTRPFEVRWTEDVLAEVVYHLRRLHPEWAGSRITGIRDRISATFETGRVDEFEVGEDYKGRDPLDAHVHAAAVACGAHYLVTRNEKDFIWDANCSTYEVLSPDEFFVLVDDKSPDLVAAAAGRMYRHWRDLTGESDLPRRLREAGCPQFADRVRRHLINGADQL